jgi:hypothetical protein
VDGICESVVTDIEINEAVARKLKGEDTRLIKNYCHSIEAAWEIVEHLRKQPLRTLFLFVVALKLDVPVGDDSLMWFFEKASPMAICLAFLNMPELK